MDAMTNKASCDICRGSGRRWSMRDGAYTSCLCREVMALKDGIATARKALWYYADLEGGAAARSALDETEGL